MTVPAEINFGTLWNVKDVMNPLSSVFTGASKTIVVREIDLAIFNFYCMRRILHIIPGITLIETCAPYRPDYFQIVALGMKEFHRDITDPNVIASNKCIIKIQ